MILQKSATFWDPLKCLIYVKFQMIILNTFDKIHQKMMWSTIAFLSTIFVVFFG